MYGRWTEIAEFLRNLLGFIWDLLDVLMAHICSARAQMQSLKSKYCPLCRNDLENCFYLDYSMTTTKIGRKKSKLISCLNTGWENKK